MVRRPPLTHAGSASTSTPTRRRTIPLRPPRRVAALIAVAALSTILLAGCAGDDWSTPHDKPEAVGTLGHGFAPEVAPTPEATINPAPGSWDAVRPSPGYRVVLLTAGDDPAAKRVASAVRDWAAAEGVDLREVPARSNPIDAIVGAIDLKPDLIVSAGNDLVDPLATVTASHLGQQFLVVGAEVAEPTGNVTAVDWSGASFRGEGNGASSTYDPTTFTAKRCASAIRAGVAAVLHDMTGIVLWID
jgi:hypothetical protein